MRITLLILLYLAACNSAAEDAPPLECGSIFASALRAYENEQFGPAARLFALALEIEPDCARCAHLLGKSYGNLAERADWSDAIGLAKKTRIALEQAVELAPEDQDAIRDLIKYYRAAPAFLGGSKDKAERLEQRLRSFQADATS